MSLFESTGRAPEVPAGAVLGKFIIGRELGRGGFGAVYEAQDTTLGRVVALKVLRASNARQRERTMREAQIAAAMFHPNIVALHEVGEERGLIYLSYELVRGKTLHALAPLAPERAARLVRDLAHAVAHAHGRGVLHRDIKPANVLVDGERVLLTDFGIGTMLDDVRLTRSGEGLGTMGFAAPEQLGGKPATPWSDVYGLGATLYHSLTGRAPWEATDDLFGMFRRPATAPSAYAKVPAPLEAVVLRCLERDPERRFRSSEDLARALDDVLEGRRASRAPLVWAVAAVVALGVLGWSFRGAPQQVTVVSGGGPRPHTGPRPVAPVGQLPMSAGSAEQVRSALARARALALERRSFQDPLDALAQARQLAGRDPTLAAEVEAERVSYLFRRGRYEEVVRTDAAARTPLLVALALERLGRTGQAAAAYDVLAADPARPLGLAARALRLTARRVSVAEADSLLTALEREVRSPTADLYLLYAHGRLLEALGRDLEAIDTLRRARDACPDEPLVLGLLGVLLMKSAPVGAHEALDAAVSLTEPEPDPAFVRARALLAMREGPWATRRLLEPDLDVVQGDLDRLLVGSPDDGELRFWRGVVKLVRRRGGAQGAPAALERPSAEEDWRAASLLAPERFGDWLAPIDPALREVIGAAAAR